MDPNARTDNQAALSVDPKDPNGAFEIGEDMTGPGVSA